MSKRIAALLCALMMVFGLAGCEEGSPINQMLGLDSSNSESSSASTGSSAEEHSSAAEDSSSSTAPLPKATQEEKVYYNGATGLKLTVPEGYYISELDEGAMTETPEESDDMDSLPFQELSQGYYSITLFNIANKGRSNHDDHAGMEGYLDYYIEYTMEDYLSDLEYNILYETEDYSYELVKKEEIDFHGKPTWYLEVETTYQEDSEPYLTQMFLVTELDTDTFLYFYADYWNDSEASKEAAEGMLFDCLDFE
ncbi:MAG: hypothetical protein ACK5LX_06550 [Oscillospiraceae bacterium]